MRRFNLIVLSLLSAAMLVSCDKLEVIIRWENPNNPQIEMHTSEVLFTTDGGNNTISFTTNEAWTAQVINSRADNWCEIYPTSGSAGDATISVITTPNDTPDDRTASIVIKAGIVSKTVTVSQKQKDALTVTSSKFEVEATGGEVKIEVKANIDFEFTIDESAKEWIKYEGTRAIKTSTLTFSVAENDDTEKREGKIAIKSGEFNEVVTIYQAGNKATIVISQNEYVVSSDGETIAVEVKSNVDVNIEIPSEIDWISENTTRATSTNTYYFDIQPNEDYEQRIAEIKFTNKENGLSETVKVYQAQEDALIISKKDIVVSDEGGTISFELHTNVDFKVSDPNVDWLRPVATRGLTSHTLNYTVDANTSYNSREAHIVVTDTKNNKSETITITQAQKDAIIVAKEQYSIGSKGGQIVIEVESNIDFDVVISNDWIKQITTRSLQSKSYTFEILQNTDKKDRQGFVKFVSQDETISQTVHINQSCANGNTEDIENGDTNEW